MHQPRAGDLGAFEKEPLQVGQPLQMHQPRAGDLGAFEKEPLQVGQPLQMCQPRVGELFDRKKACRLVVNRASVYSKVAFL